MISKVSRALRALLILLSAFAPVATGSVNTALNITASINMCRSLDFKLGNKPCFHMNDIFRRDVEMLRGKKAVEESILPHLISSQNPDDIVVVIHAFNMYKDVKGFVILEYILRELRVSGLQRIAIKTFVVLNGYFPPSFSLHENHQKVTFIKMPSVQYFEYPGLTLVYEQALLLHPNAKILYVHTKGSTSKSEDNLKEYWLDVMLHYYITLYNQSVTLLNNGWDTSGINPMSNPFPHYSGNFFWAKASYFRIHTINVTDLIWHWRFGAEYWLLGASKHKSTKIFKSKYHNGFLWKYFLARRTVYNSPELYVKNFTGPPD